MKITVCVHLYHGYMWDEIEFFLKNIKYDFDLIVNFPIIHEFRGKYLPNDFNWQEYLFLNSDLEVNGIKNEELAIRHFLRHGIFENRKYKLGETLTEKINKFNTNSKIIYSPNRGVDIGGFLYSYKYVNPNTDLILKIHTKTGLGDKKNPSQSILRKGVDNATNIGRKWFLALMGGVLKNENQVNNIINEFKNNDKCGMVGFRLDNNFSLNEKEMEKIYQIINIGNKHNNTFFVGGTIFWMDNNILKKYLSNEIIEKIIDILPYNYVHEPSPNHAMERIFGCMVYNENKKLLIIN